MSVVRYKHGEFPPITEERKAELKALETREIDFSDIPPMDDALWANAISNPWREISEMEKRGAFRDLFGVVKNLSLEDMDKAIEEGCLASGMAGMEEK